MIVRYTALALALSLAAGCAPEAEDVMASSDDRIDFIFETDMGRMARCVNVVQLEMLGHNPRPSAVPTGLHPGNFQSPPVRELARQVAQGRGKKVDIEISGIDVNPQTAGVQCNASVSKPVEIGDYSFVEFASPDGRLGAYAFMRRDDAWQPAERIKLGFW